MTGVLTMIAYIGIIIAGAGCSNRGVPMAGLVRLIAVAAIFIVIQNLERLCTRHGPWEITLGYIR